VASVSKSFPHKLTSSDLTGTQLINRERWKLWLQLTVGYAFLEAALWSDPGPAAVFCSLLTVVTVLLFAFDRHYSRQEMGLGIPSLDSIRWTFSLGLLAAALLPLAATLTGANALPTHAMPLRTAVQYSLWAFVQQFILQSFFFVRLETLLGSRKAVFATTALFALAHLPNTILTVVTIFAGLFFCELFRRYRNIFPLGAVHALLGLTMAASFSDSLLRHMRVGMGYFLLRLNIQ
jgi:membrane protease YdiL (CAAX protease family)